MEHRFPLETPPRHSPRRVRLASPSYTRVVLAVMLSLSCLCNGSSRIVAVATARRGGAFVWGSALPTSSSSAISHPRFCSSFIRAFPSSSSPTHHLHHQQQHQLQSILVRHSSQAQFSSSAVEGSPAAVEPAAAAAAAAGAEAGASPSAMLAPKRARPRRTVTGGLKNLPVCPPANELLNRALRISKWLKVRRK